MGQDCHSPPVAAEAAAASVLDAWTIHSTQRFLQCVHKKQAREFLAYFQEDWWNCGKFWGLIPESTQDTIAVAFPAKPV